MVDKKTGLKPKAKKSEALNLETSDKKITTNQPKAKKIKPKTKETKKQISNSELPPSAEPEAQLVKAGPESVVALAKAGKRSAKSLREAEELAAKEARKAATKADESKPKVARKPARTKLERAGKRYREVAKLIEKSKTYSLLEALDLATKTSITKFDATVELHVNLGVDPKEADHNVRGIVSLPAGTGKQTRVAVFTEADNITQAKAAGADLAGSDELLANLDKEEIDFDILITTPNLMPRLGKYARLLGPKGLMPNPKSGSITNDITKAVKEAKSGRLEYRLDQAGIIHLGVGKVSFGKDKLIANTKAILASIQAAKPASLKGIYIKSMYVSTTMGPSIKVEI